VTADPTPLVVVLLGMVLLAGVATALARDLLVVTVVFGAYSLTLAILWVTFRAPDVALTEAAVGAGVTTSLLLVAIARTETPVGGIAFALPRRPGSVLAGGGLVVALGATLPALPAVGDPGAPAFGDDAAAAFYLDGAASFGVDNVVTAVLVVFRGFDTFGEVAVVFAAAVAVLAVVGRGVR
jgi:multicomponent Na+:H+ antiporter subunit B